MQDRSAIGTPGKSVVNGERFDAGLGVDLNGRDSGVITLAHIDRRQNRITMPAGDLRQLRIRIEPGIAEVA